MRQGFLEATVVGEIRTWRRGSIESLVHLQGFPAPVFHVTVQEREIGALLVPISRDTPPGVRHCARVDDPSRLQDEEKPCVEALYVFVEKIKHTGRRRKVVLGELEQSPIIVLSRETHSVAAVRRV